MIYWSESPPTSQRTQMALLEEQRERADDEKIRRTRQSQIDRTEGGWLLVRLRSGLGGWIEARALETRRWSS